MNQKIDDKAKLIIGTDCHVFTYKRVKILFINTFSNNSNNIYLG